MEDNAKKKMTPELRAATLDSVVSREIVQEILKFGVTQSQILKIIGFSYGARKSRYDVINN